MNQLLVILDLDETLIHSVESLIDRPPDFNCGPYSVYMRPGLTDFLSRLRERFRIAIWTSSSRDYADCIVCHTFPASYPLEFMWCRERCTLRLDDDTRKPYWLKNLRKVKRGGHDLSRVVCVDDSPEKHSLNYGNLVRVRAYLGEAEDNELPRLLQYLEVLDKAPDVRRVEKRSWQNTLAPE